MTKLLPLLSLAFASPALAAPSIGTLILASGSITLNGKAVETGAALHKGDVLETAKDSRAMVKLGSDRLLVVRPETTLTLGPTETELKKGGTYVHVKPGSKRKFTLRTHGATMGVRGTSFYTEDRGEHVYFCPCEGVVRVAMKGGSVSSGGEGHNSPLKILNNDHGLKDRIRDGKDEPLNHSHDEITTMKAALETDKY